MFNGKENVVVEKCEFLENVGPDVFPASSKDICPLEKEWKQLPARTRKFPMIFYLFNFLSLTKVDIAEFANKFTNPFLSGNRFHDVPDKLFQRSPVAMLQDIAASSVLTQRKIFIMLFATPFLKATKNLNRCGLWSTHQ